MAETNAQTSPSGTDQGQIFLTPAAVTEIKRLLSEQDDAENIVLRVGVQGGGCSGLSYHMAFDTKVEEFDQTFDFDGVKVVVDNKSILYINGTTIDFTREMLTGGFKFNNPNVQRSCGCGTSFSV